MITGLMDSPAFAYAVLPAAIFLARIVDVSIGTVRIILTGKGMRYLAPLLGFVEVLIWLLAIGQIMQNLSNWLCYVAYAAGFATGNFVGILIEGRLALGVALVRIIVPGDPERLLEYLKESRFRTTRVPAEGEMGPVEIIFTVVSRKQLPEVESVIRRFNPKAFYTVEDVRSAAGVRSGLAVSASSSKRAARARRARKGK
ncbi:DUF2179 domain-containing protein [Candidatus Fermentibacterales bacterium]|nr:DUF2179 domain-containing protein [Candidatus Fermentibacterales bacterium]